MPSLQLFIYYDPKYLPILMNNKKNLIMISIYYVKKLKEGLFF